jgi:hypothetical protein
VSSDDNLDRSRSLAVYIQAISDDTLDRLRSVAVYIQTIFRIFCVALLVTNSICQSTARKVGCFFFGTPRWRLPEITEAREWA